MRAVLNSGTSFGDGALHPRIHARGNRSHRLALEEERNDLALEQVVEQLGLDARRRSPSVYSSPRPIAHPTSLPWSRHASAHQPSSTLTFSAPLAAAFMPLVPLASSGRRGVLSHTSTPRHHRARDAHVVVLDEDDVAAQLGVAARVDDRADQLLAALVLRVRLAREDELHRALAVAEEALHALDVA